MTPASRIRRENDRPVDPYGRYVLYWMTSARRTRFNFALQRATELSLELGKPLLILEAVRCAYPHASDRLHTFLLQGMADNARAIARTRAIYYPYVEPAHGEGRGLLRGLSRQAAAVVTDWFPAFFLPRMLRAAAAQCAVRLESVDTNGLVPVASHERPFPTARGYRGFVQRHLREHLAAYPAESPLASLAHGPAEVPPAILAQWPAVDLHESAAAIVSRLSIDHTVPAVNVTGGTEAGRRVLEAFLETKLRRYAADANHPDADCTSRLSPYLHFGHLSVHDVFAAVMTHEGWTTRKLGTGKAGAREGWWHVTPGAEQFLDQLVVWRELAFNGAAWLPRFETYDSLPGWARATLDAHLADERPDVYPRARLDAADTGDEVWNAAQTELRQTGWCHGYMRMVWGKKLLEWSEHPREALASMEALMNRHALDGRDPVSYLNYAWVLGRYDRPWFERPIFGTVRCMTTRSARRKLKMQRYLATYAVKAR